MCGLVGYWSRTGTDAGALRRALPAAVESIRHRGPDGEGVWWSPDAAVGLGHRRLAVIDLTPGGAQPMLARDAEVAIIYNGEIYNFREIAEQLKACGRTLTSHSDTEVILESFRQWGPDCVNRFIGMFAFAIWDGPRRRLSLCRDRAGVKPLYWAWNGAVLSFASELKALRALPHVKPEVDLAAMGDFLQYGYVAQPRAIYRGVSKLEPGTWLHLDATGEPRLERYWSLRDIVAQGPLAGSERDLEEELESLLVDAFKLRMVADVPVGLFLSGGVDSSLVAGLLKRAGADVETYTVGFDAAEHDESTAAAGVARALDLPNHRIMADMTEAERVLGRWPDMFDEPFGDHSGVPTYMVSRMAREHVTVALSADGGDELFCGYAGYSEAAGRMAAHGRLPSWGRNAGARGLDLALGAGPINSGVAGGLVLDRMHKLRGYLGAEPGLDALRPFRSFWQPGEIRRLIGSDYADPRLGTLAWPGEAMEQIAALDFFEYLPDDVLTKTDRATMAASLEGREPMLDHRIIAMAFRMPLSVRSGPNASKQALRNILYRNVPRELVDRPKHGFSVPIAQWTTNLIKRGGVAEAIDHLVSKLGLDRAMLASSVKGYAGSAQGLNRIWLLYVLGQWAGRWL